MGANLRRLSNLVGLFDHAIADGAEAVWDEITDIF
jgi:hypothetical protein